jgi:hypothetical protein
MTFSLTTGTARTAALTMFDGACHRRRVPWFKRPPVKLHIGSGDKPLAGWINVDRKRGPGVDVVADVRGGLRFSNVEAIYAEHFLDHLALRDAVAFLLEAHRVLLPGYFLRLSTPNVDWVWSTHYRLDAPEPEKRLAALHANRAFHGATSSSGTGRCSR